MFLGAPGILKFKLGTQVVDKVYAGTNQIWGRNLFLNPGFDDASVWTLTGTVTLSGGLCNFNGGATEHITQPVVTPGLYYRISVDIVSLTSGIIRCAAGFTIYDFPAGTGRKSVVLQATTNTTTFFRGVSATGTIDNVEIYEVPAP